MTATARRKTPPGSEHQEPEHCVCEHENPGRRLVEENSLYPVLDETLAVARRTSPHTEPGFNGCERTDLTQPCLRDNDPDGCKVCKAKPKAIHPVPTATVSCYDGHQPSDDEQDDDEVQHENSIGKTLIRHGYRPCDGKALMGRISCSLPFANYRPGTNAILLRLSRNLRHSPATTQLSPPNGWRVSGEPRRETEGRVRCTRVLGDGQR